MKKTIIFSCFFLLFAMPFFAQTNSSKDNLQLNEPTLLKYIAFDYNKATFGVNPKKKLEIVAKLMTKYPDIEVEISNHTDARGKAEYNLDLSQRRADALVEYLVEEWEIDEERLTAVGYGESKPLNRCVDGVNDCTEEEHQTNRRTEFTIVGFAKE